LVSHPATIQAHYLAFPHSLVAPFMDYYIGDEVLIPKEAKQYFTENLVLLNQPYIMPSYEGGFDPLKAPYLRQRKDFALPEDKFIFASFNAIGKLTPEVFSLWIRILNRIPNSVLLLRTPSTYGQNLVEVYAEKQGLSPKRIIWGTYADTKDEHLEFARLVDVHLDSGMLVKCQKCLLWNSSVWSSLDSVRCALVRSSYCYSIT
jgi:protein O-GlcNAc transferase